MCDYQKEWGIPGIGDWPYDEWQQTGHNVLTAHHKSDSSISAGQWEVEWRCADGKNFLNFHDYFFATDAVFNRLRSPESGPKGFLYGELHIILKPRNVRFFFFRFFSIIEFLNFRKICTKFLSKLICFFTILC